MNIEEKNFGRDEWTRLVEKLPGLSMMQTFAFAEAKAATGPWTPLRAIVRDGETSVAIFQGITRKLPLVGGGLLWINRGPLLIEDVRYEDVLAAVARWAKQKRWYVRVAPPRESIGDVDGFASTDSGGWCSSIADLTVTNDALRASLDGKWRNCLNKAVRLGVTVTSGATRDDYASLLQKRLDEKPFATSVTPEFLRAFDAETIVFTAMQDGKTIGANLMTIYGDTGEYTSGVLTDEGRAVNAGHALLWTAMTELQSRGIRDFDLGGMHPQRTPKGIFHFKEGVRGRFYCLANELETSRRDWRSALIRSRIAKARQAEEAQQ